MKRAEATQGPVPGRGVVRQHPAGHVLDDRLRQLPRGERTAEEGVDADAQQRARIEGWRATPSLARERVLDFTQVQLVHQLAHQQCCMPGGERAAQVERQQQRLKRTKQDYTRD